MTTASTPPDWDGILIKHCAPDEEPPYEGPKPTPEVVRYYIRHEIQAIEHHMARIAMLEILKARVMGQFDGAALVRQRLGHLRNKALDDHFDFEIERMEQSLEECNSEIGELERDLDRARHDLAEIRRWALLDGILPPEDPAVLSAVMILQ